MKAIILYCLTFIVLGYLSGSVLYARVFGPLLAHTDVTLIPEDHNPGTVSAYTYGGFWCGTLTLICDLLKGFLPVWLAIHLAERLSVTWTGSAAESVRGLTVESAAIMFLQAFVLAAPVIGHILPIFCHFQGGKAIAVSFGVFLALLPNFWPVAILAALYIFFSAVIVIDPTINRAYFVYLLTALFVGIAPTPASVNVGCGLICLAICLRHFFSHETHVKQTVHFGFKWSDIK